MGAHVQFRWKPQDPSPVEERERAFWARDLISRATPKGESDGSALLQQGGDAIVIVILSPDGEYEVIDAKVVRRADVRVRDEE